MGRRPINNTARRCGKKGEVQEKREKKRKIHRGGGGSSREKGDRKSFVEGGFSEPDRGREGMGTKWDLMSKNRIL